MKGKNKWEICDKETEQWKHLLDEFRSAAKVLDRLTTERKNGHRSREEGRREK